jgi:hypothetical protein
VAATEGEAPDSRRLREAIRRHPLLEPAVRRRWIDLIPYLSPDERLELWTILSSGAEGLAALERGGTSRDQA